MPFGPSDPTFPTPSWPVYNALARGDCGTLQAEAGAVGDFGAAMVAVCLAAVEGEPEQWDVLEGLSGADPSQLANDCLSPIVSDLLDRALAWHREHPGETPSVAFKTVEGQTECGQQSDEESQLEDSEGPSEPAGETGNASPPVEGESAEESSQAGDPSAPSADVSESAGD